MKEVQQKAPLILGGKVILFMDKIMLFNIRVITKLMENIFLDIQLILIMIYKKKIIKLQIKFIYGMLIIIQMVDNFFFQKKKNLSFVR